MVGRPNEKVSVPKCMIESQSYGTPGKEEKNLQNNFGKSQPTIVLALVADVIGVFIIVFDVLLQDPDMPEKCLPQLCTLSCVNPWAGCSK